MSCHAGPDIVENGLVLCLDAANSKSFSPNVFPNSLDIYTWYVDKEGSNIGNACTVSQDFNTIRSPVNGIPMKMSITGHDPYIASYNAAEWNISTASNGQTWTVSFYAKASTNLNDCEIFIFGANSSGGVHSGTDYYGITAKSIAITTEWKRFEHSITFNNTEISYIQIRLDGQNNGGEGADIWWDGLQIELSSTATQFNSIHNLNRSLWYDLSGESYHATLYNTPTYASNVFQFRSASSMYATSTFDEGVLRASNVAGQWSIEVYFKQISTSSSNEAFVAGREGCHGGIYIYSDNTLKHAIKTTECWTGAINTTVTNMTNGNWYHSVMSYNNGTINHYVDGSLISTSIFDKNTYTIRSYNTTFYIGGHPYTTLYKTNIDLRIVRCYNKELSAAEVAQNFNATRRIYGI